MSEGHAVIDAMVAMMIISMALILSLQALDQGARVARRAREVREAKLLIDALMLDGPKSFTPVNGQSRGFDWTVQTQITGAERPIEVCRRAVSLASESSPRTYGAATLVTCPPLPIS